MNDQTDEPLSADEAAAFAALPREIDPPAELEQRVVAGVRPARRVGSPVRTWQRAALGLAAAAVVFVSGYVTATRMAQTSGSSLDGRYLLLLYDTPGTPTGDPAQGERMFAEYSAWYTRAHAAGQVEQGEKLEDAAETLGPAVAASRAPSGFFVVKARSLDDAVAISRECPHTRYGGTVVVRPIAR